MLLKRMTRSSFLPSPDDLPDQCPAAGMKRTDQVGPVVHRDLGLVVKGLVEVSIIGFVVFPLDGEHRDA